MSRSIQHHYGEVLNSFSQSFGYDGEWLFQWIANGHRFDAGQLHIANDVHPVSQFGHVEGRNVFERDLNARFGGSRRNAANGTRQALSDVGRSIDRVQSQIKLMATRSTGAESLPLR